MTKYVVEMKLDSGRWYKLDDGYDTAAGAVEKLIEVQDILPHREFQLVQETLTREVLSNGRV